MVVSRIIEFKQNSLEGRKKNDMVGNTAFFLPLTATHVCPLYSTE